MTSCGNESMAEPGVDRDGDLREGKPSAETLPSQISTDSEDAGATSSRSLSEREDSDITSSVSSAVDETPSLVTLNSASLSASTDEPQASVKSALEGEEGAGLMSVEAGTEMPTHLSVPPSSAPSSSAPPSSAPPSSAPSSSAPPSSAPSSSAPPSSAPPSSAPPSVQEHYYVKWITWKGEKTPIITQSENGPCPLLAIMNILFLRWKAKLPPQTEVITIEELMAHLGECVLSIKPREKAEGMELNFQQNMSDAMVVLPKLSTGLDVNVRFTGVADFEYTPECIVFDLLNIPLYHGWLVDPQSPETSSAVGKLSYNQLVEKIIVYKHSTDCSQVSEGLIAEQFLESTATQLSYHGLCELNTTATEGELCVFFRNNHFSTMIKHKGHLYLLVTDQGFLQEDSVVWESLHNVEGDGNFCDSEFRLCHASQKGTSRSPAQQQQMQIEQDYLVAMSLQQSQGEAPGPLSDLELARQLQQEEYQQPQQQQQQQQQQPPSPHTSSEPTRGGAVSEERRGRRRQGEKKDDSDCSIL